MEQKSYRTIYKKPWEPTSTTRIISNDDLQKKHKPQEFADCAIIRSQPNPEKKELEPITIEPITPLSLWRTQKLASILEDVKKERSRENEPLLDENGVVWSEEWMNKEIDGILVSEMFCKLPKPGYAQCMWCPSDLTYYYSGFRALRAHCRTQRHKAKVKFHRLSKGETCQIITETDCVQISETGKSYYTCKYCKQAFMRFGNCKNHMQLCRTEPKRPWTRRNEHQKLDTKGGHNVRSTRGYQCDVCHKKYPEAQYLKQHKLVHQISASKIYLCTQCPFKSRYKQGVCIHIRTHTSDRPYKCDDCTKSFVTKQSLKLHHCMVHQQTHPGFHDKEPLRCKFCSLKFKNKETSRKHMETLHSTLKKVIRSIIRSNKMQPEVAVAKRKAMIVKKIRKRARTPKLAVIVRTQTVVHRPVSSEAKEAILRAEKKWESALGQAFAQKQQMSVEQCLVTQNGQDMGKRYTCTTVKDQKDTNMATETPLQDAMLAAINIKEKEDKMSADKAPACRIKKEHDGDNANIPPMCSTKTEDDDEDDVIIVDSVKGRKSRKQTQNIKREEQSIPSVACKISEVSKRPKGPTNRKIPELSYRSKNKPPPTHKKPQPSGQSTSSNSGKMDFLRIQLNIPKMTRVEATKSNVQKKKHDSSVPVIKVSLCGATQMPVQNKFVSTYSDTLSNREDPFIEDNHDDDVQIIDEPLSNDWNEYQEHKHLPGIKSETEIGPSSTVTEIKPVSLIKDEIKHSTNLEGAYVITMDNGEQIEIHRVDDSDDEPMPKDINSTVKSEPVMF